jgi:tetratricopeptide (TPR) repeat protein
LGRQGNISGAQAAYEEDIETYRKISDKGRTAAAANNLDILFQEQGRLDDAHKQFENALALFRETKRSIDVAMTLGNLGDLAILQGNLREANDRFQEQLEIGEKVPQPKQAAYALFGLGEVSFYKDELDSARGYFQRSLDKREQMHEMGTAAESRLGLAAVELERGRPQDADIQAQKARQEFVKERQDDLVASASGLLARALWAEQKKEEALETAEAAEKLADSSDDRDIRTQVELDVAKVFTLTDQRSNALREFHAAVDESKRFHFAIYRLQAEVGLAQLQMASGASVGRALLLEARSEATERGLFLIARQATVPANLLTKGAK